MAPVRNITKFILAVVATGMVALLAGAFSTHAEKHTTALAKLKKEGNAPHFQKKVVFKRRVTLEGETALTEEVLTVRQVRRREARLVEPILSFSFFHPSLRGPPAAV